MANYDYSFVKRANELIKFEDKVVLDLGCGYGTVVKEIANKYKAKMVIGVDSNLKSWWNMSSIRAKIGKY